MIASNPKLNVETREFNGLQIETRSSVQGYRIDRTFIEDIEDIPNQPIEVENEPPYGGRGAHGLCISQAGKSVWLSYHQLKKLIEFCKEVVPKEYLNKKEHP